MASDSVIIVGNKLNNVITIICAILIFGLIIVGYFGWKNIHEENVKLKNEITEFKNITESLVRSSTYWATKSDLENSLKDTLTKEDLKAVKKDMEDIGSKLFAVGKTVGIIGKKVENFKLSDQVGPPNKNTEVCEKDGRLIDIHEYTKNPQIKLLTDINEAPLAKVEFNAIKQKPWGYEIYKRNHRLTTIVGKKKSGQLTFHHKLEYSVPDISMDRYYGIKILSSNYIQTPLKNRMFWFNPILDSNFFLGGKIYGKSNKKEVWKDDFSIGIDVGLSFSSYGETESDSWFRLFRLGLGCNVSRESAHFSFSPFSFNIGKPLPLLTNLYFAPQIAIDSKGGVTINLGFGPHF